MKLINSHTDISFNLNSTLAFIHSFIQYIFGAGDWTGGLKYDGKEFYC